MDRAQQIIRQLELAPHPEGGYFRETYRSKGATTVADFGKNAQRNFATCIYFLLTSDMFSAFHRIRQDEIWHFYEGTPIELHIISNTGKHSEVIIGNDLAQGHRPQFVVPAEYWFAARTLDGGAYALVGCTVSPGFDFADFELPEREVLLAEFPEHRDIIIQFTRV
ncbi:cupin domain-containing protein [Flavobacteriaceae bacterium 3-367]